MSVEIPVEFDKADDEIIVPMNAESLVRFSMIVMEALDACPVRPIPAMLKEELIHAFAVSYVTAINEAIIEEVPQLQGNKE
jgi:hypothetical protein